MGIITPATATTAPTSGPINVPITEQMLAMLNYATMRSLMGITQPITTPEGILTTQRIAPTAVQTKEGGEAAAAQTGKRRTRKNMVEDRGRNKRKFITNNVQIEDVTDSTSGTTPQRSLGVNKGNDKLKEKVSFLRSQLKSLETELKEHDRNIEVNEFPDQYESRFEEPKRELPKRNRRRPTETIITKEREGRNIGTPTMPLINKSPFSDERLLEPLTENYRPISLDYDGTTDLEVHMALLEGLAALHQYVEGIKCRIFATTLSGMAQRWFHNLRSNSIQSYGDLYLMFMRQFASSKRVGRTAISLMDIKQEPQETLREYVARFNITALDIPEAESQIKWYAFARGLR
ncbi:uncharacterized protein LOC130994243 [Salvia miltiorrhiza]|uniref:uncharacterized protein LOC130994243 n=1 Tax=Salvia miltiorrhiza TaxID=226208 RepID=UPI0025AD38F7|nr:uncharacterized protein LOC130994243 [Salvia miltiorrhiza]